MMKYGDKIGILCCSDGQKSTYEKKLKFLADTLSEIGLVPVFGQYIYATESVFGAPAKERAKELMDFYRDDEIKGIFDISGGDLANGILPYLDYELIGQSSKIFWGYSDLTTVINAIYAKTGKASVLYQIRNLIYADREIQIANFSNAILYDSNELFEPSYHFLNGNEMRGVLVGGNIRCFLKLAGTGYMPETEGKILLLEGYSGTVAKMETYLCQIQQLGIFDNIAGIILGTFTEMEQERCFPDMETLIKKFIRDDMPIAYTKQIGHGIDSKALWIGKEIYWCK